MKKLLQITAIALAAGTVLLSTGCKKKISNDDNTLEIYTYLGGYGDEFVREGAKKFMELHPEVNVEFKGDQTPDKVKNKLLAGPNNNTTDLFFSGENFFNVLDQGPRALKGYDCVIEPLDDVYETVMENGKTIKEMMNPSYVGYAQFKVNGEKHLYTFPWANSLTGIIYNKTKFENDGIEVPLTTDMLIEESDKIIAKGHKAFISSSMVGYYEYLLETLHMQYEGIDNYENFYRGIDNGRYSKDIFKQKGRLYSLEVLEQIVATKYGRSHENINTMSYPQAQTKFLLGEAYMMVNGDWLENELRTLDNSNIRKEGFQFMKTPIISKIIEKTPTIKNDAMLREVVKYVDGTITTKPEGVSDADIAYITEARHYIHTIGTNHNAIIPVYASAKKWAKEFLRFLCSADGIKIYQDNTSGNSLPLKNEYIMNDTFYNSLSDFQKTKYDILNGSKFGRHNFPMVYRGGLGPYIGERRSPEIVLAVKGDHAQTAKQIYDAEIKYYTDSVWNSMLTKAGVEK